MSDRLPSFVALILGGMLLLGACRESPTLSLPEDQLIEVMTDMFLAEAAMQRLTKQIKDTISITYYDQIYEIHEVTREEYLANLRVLERNPKLAKQIYDKVLARVNTLANED